MAVSDTTTGDLPNALKLKGTANYLPWVGDITTLLQAKDLDKYIRSESQKPLPIYDSEQSTSTQDSSFTPGTTIQEPLDGRKDNLTNATDISAWVQGDAKARMVLIRNVQQEPG